jgi:hypothetical protein
MGLEKVGGPLTATECRTTSAAAFWRRSLCGVKFRRSAEEVPEVEPLVEQGLLVIFERAASGECRQKRLTENCRCIGSELVE